MAQDTEFEEQLARAKKRIGIADKVRVALLGIALVVLLLIYFGNKFYEGTAWFDAAVHKAYIAATYVVLLMVAATFAKLFMVMKYNKLVKDHR